MKFTVLAGKYDGDEVNYKYIDDFETLDEAISAWLKVSDYPIHEIEYTNNEGVTMCVTPYNIQGELKC